MTNEESPFFLSEELKGQERENEEQYERGI
jgi:hypothetical protein